MKKILVALAALAAFALALVILLVLRLDPEVLGARLIEQVNRQSGIRLEAEEFSLHPLRGLELIDASASGRLESGEVMATVARMRMKHQILPLLRGELVIEEVLLQKPTIELIARSPAEMRQARKGAGGDRNQSGKRKGKNENVDQGSEAVAESSREDALRLSIERLGIEEGRLSIRTAGHQEAGFRIEELNLVLKRLAFDPASPSSTEAVSGEGRFSTGRLTHGDLEALETRGEIRLAGGTAELTELNVHSANADIMLSKLTVVMLQEPPAYDLVAAGGLDLNGVLGFDTTDGFGRVAIDLEAEGEGPEVSEMVGKGTLVLNAGSIPGVPSVVQIEDFIGRPLLTGRRYERTEIDYRLIENAIVLEPFEIIGEGANIGGSGEIDLSGPLDLDVFVRLPAGSLEDGKLNEEQLEELTDQDGSVTIPFRISGSIENPQVQLTSEGMKALAKEAAAGWVEQALEEAKKKASEWLKSQSEDRDDG